MITLSKGVVLAVSVYSYVHVFQVTGKRIQMVCVNKECFPGGRGYLCMPEAVDSKSALIGGEHGNLALLTLKY